MKDSGIRPAILADIDPVLAIEHSWPTTPRWTPEHFKHEIQSERSYFCVSIDSPSRHSGESRNPDKGTDPIHWTPTSVGVTEEISHAGRVTGYAGLLLTPPEAQVTTVAVHPDRARRGLGRRLMEHLHATASRRGCSAVSLEVSAVNAPALSLYESLGYRIVGRRAKYYNDGSDALLMIYRLAGNGNE